MPRTALSYASAPETGIEPERVVIVNDTAETNGGATKLALLAAELLAKSGVAVTYVTGDRGDAGALAALGIEVVALGARSLLQTPRPEAFVSGLYNVRARSMLAAWIERNDTPRTVYHVHGWAQILSASVFSALQPVASRTLVHAHDFFLACPNGGYMNYVSQEACGFTPLSFKCVSCSCDKRNYAHKLWRVARQAVRASLLDFSAQPTDVLMIHEGMRPYFRRAGIPEERLHTVLNPCDALSDERVPAESNREFFFIGRVVAEKGVEDLLEAARAANVPARIIGEGPLRAALESRYPEAVFEGWKDTPALRGLIGRARALVMPTRYPEPFGLVGVEALKSGVPVVLPPGAFIARDVVEGGMGIAVDTRNVPAFTDTLRAIARDDESTLRMSLLAYQNGAQLAATAAGWCDALLARYRATLARP